MRNLNAELKTHETSNEHIIDMSVWANLGIRLLKNKTIDKNVLDQINKEENHWENVPSRIIVVVKTLAKNNVAFQGINKKIYQHNNGNF